METGPGDELNRQEDLDADLTAEITARLRAAGARFAFVFGSRAEGTARADSDTDVAAWWGDDAPAAWDVALPPGADLVVLDRAPLWLAGRVAQRGRILFDDDPPARVEWQATTRAMYLDELPGMLARQAAWRQAVGRG